VHNSAVKIAFTALCAYAAMDVNTGSNMFGIFESFELPAVPGEVRRFFIALFLDARDKDFDTKHLIRLHLVDPQKKPTPVDVTFALDTPPRPTDPRGRTRANLSIEVGGLVFTQYGEYLLIIEDNGKRIASEIIGVRKPGEGTVRIQIEGAK